MGVTFLMVMGLLLAMPAPIMTEPPTIRLLPWPLRWFTKRGRPTMPPAPPTFSKAMLPTRPAALAARSMARAVPSQPPPGAAGTNMLMVSNRGLPWAQAGSTRLAPAAALMLRKSRLLMFMEVSCVKMKKQTAHATLDRIVVRGRGC